MLKNKKTPSSKLSAPSYILGVDPGYGRIGIAILEKEGHKERLVHSECFETDNKLPHHRRLVLIANRIEEVINEFEPKKLAIETLLFSKNTKTALKVAESRGVVIMEAAKKGLFVSEFNPNSIKLAVTGYGKSDKKQIIGMINRIFNIKHKIDFDDEYDAISVALTCAVTKEVII